MCAYIQYIYIAFKERERERDIGQLFMVFISVIQMARSNPLAAGQLASLLGPHREQHRTGGHNVLSTTALLPHARSSASTCVARHWPHTHATSHRQQPPPPPIPPPSNPTASSTCSSHEIADAMHTPALESQPTSVTQPVAARAFPTHKQSVLPSPPDAPHVRSARCAVTGNACAQPHASRNEPRTLSSCLASTVAGHSVADADTASTVSSRPLATAAAAAASSSVTVRSSERRHHQRSTVAFEHIALQQSQPFTFPSRLLDASPPAQRYDFSTTTTTTTHDSRTARTTSSFQQVRTAASSIRLRMAYVIDKNKVPHVCTECEPLVCRQVRTPLSLSHRPPAYRQSLLLLLQSRAQTPSSHRLRRRTCIGGLLTHQVTRLRTCTAALHQAEASR